MLLLILAGGIVLIVVLGLQLASSRTVNTQDLTIGQLVDAGYYAYVLPTEVENELQWQRTISMWGFDWHCIKDGDSRDDRWNPLTVAYSDTSGINPLVIRVSPQDGVFDESRAKSVVHLVSSWISEGTGIYYTSEDGTVLKVIDTLGMEVIITSPNGQVQQIVELVNQLEFVGANTNQNPWYKTCNS